MLSEFECGNCKTRFLVTLKHPAEPTILPTIYCVCCGRQSLKCVGDSDADVRRIIVTQNEIRDVFGIEQEVLVRMGTEWVPREILAITVQRKATCSRCGMLTGEPRFWFKDIGNAPLDDVMAKEDIREG